MSLTLAVVATTLGIDGKLPGENRQQYRARLAAAATPYAVKKVAAAQTIASYEAAREQYHMACLNLGRVLSIYAEPDERHNPAEYDLRVAGFARKFVKEDSARGAFCAKWLAANIEPTEPSATAAKLARRLN